MFSGGDYEEVGRWVLNFVSAHAKREHPRVEAVVHMAGAREGKSYGLGLRLGEQCLPPEDQAPIELAYSEVAARRGSLAWCNDFATRVRRLARELADASHGSPQTA